MFTKVKASDLSTLYSSDNQKRYDELAASFASVFGRKPEFIARAPGRVNIIGEHIDYQGYGVLPAAIEKDCLIAVATNNSKDVSVHHVNSKIYPNQILKVDPEQKHEFINNYLKYFRAGYRAGVKDMPRQTLKGLEVMISGNIPTAAGLSSSSALCVCSALAAFQANGGKEGPKEQFIERVIKGQRQTGTASGGMDQSISVMGRQQSCLYIQFNPIRCEKVNLPQGCKFVIMNSLVSSAKLETAVFRYNKRVCQCRLAVRIMAKKLQMPGSPKILKELEQWSGISLHMLRRLVQTFLDHHDYSKQELQTLIGEPLKDILNDIPLSQEVLKANKHFRIWQAAKHVFEQANRVIEYVQICNSHLGDYQKLVLLGKLMNQSQYSCRHLYECSCPQIDEITNMALEKGALGSRLTGAGWGGCTVSLVPSEKVKDFIEGMVHDYYSKKGELQLKIGEMGIENVVFESLPSEGACLIPWPSVS